MSARPKTPETLAVLSRLVADRAFDRAGHLAKICVFLGAGADLSSGGISFAELKRQAIEKFSGHRLSKYAQPEDVDERFAAVFRGNDAEDKALLVDWLFHRMEPLAPSDGYKLLVLLADCGGVDAIVTTNFDGMLEKAQQELGRDLFQVYAPGVARPYMLSDGRFELPRKPYLKLHGDIASRTVVFLTEEEIRSPSYDPSMIGLLENIVRSHDLVFVGYGGNDPGLAQIIHAATKNTTNRIFWCSPNQPVADAPLPKLLGNRIRFVGTKFDELMVEVARPVLERPSLLVTRPQYLRCLFEWRLDYCNREFLRTYGERNGVSLVGTFARRPGPEEQVGYFLRSDSPLAVISGPSGFGKTTLGINLHKTWRDHRSTRILLTPARGLPDSGDIEQHILDRLGGLGSRAPSSLLDLERWLATNDTRLLIYVDGINEYSPDLARCVQLFRNILRFCYFLPERKSAIRIVATVRQETWNVMLSHLDYAQLRHALWSETRSEQGISTITCGAFTDAEVDDALNKLKERGYAPIHTDILPANVASRLHDPYLLGAVAEALRQGLPTLGASIYQRIFERKLKQRGSLIDSATLADVLSSLALLTLSRQQDVFREIDINPASIRGEIVRIAKDLHILVEAEGGFLSFDHDRTLEFFLALAFGSGEGPRFDSLDDLLRFIRSFRNLPRAIAAARLHFQLLPEQRFEIIENSLSTLDSDGGRRYGQNDRELLFGFGCEVLSELVEQREPVALDLLRDVSVAATKGAVGPSFIRAVAQCSAKLPVDEAVDVLTSITHAQYGLAAIEAGIYAADKLSSLYLDDGCPDIRLTEAHPYSSFFGDPRSSPWLRMGRLLGFAARIGADNAHPNEYADASRTMNSTLDLLLGEPPWPVDAVAGIADYIRENCDRLLFNATEEAIDAFFAGDARAPLIATFERLKAGNALSLQEFELFGQYTRTFDTEVEYHLCHLALIVSSFLDLDQTLSLIRNRLVSMSDTASPVEIDFLHAGIVYLHVLHN